jgi:serine/threonine protein kinase
LVHQDNIKLADFGSLKRIKAVSNSQSYDTIPYIDPQKFIIKNFSFNEKSDVYSVGVLLWEISSGKKPFCDVSCDFSLALQISQGLREKIVPGTPIDYSRLYTGYYNFQFYLP